MIPQRGLVVTLAGLVLVSFAVNGYLLLLRERLLGEIDAIATLEKSRREANQRESERKDRELHQLGEEKAELIREAERQRQIQELLISRESAWTQRFYDRQEGMLGDLLDQQLREIDRQLAKLGYVDLEIRKRKAS